MFSTAKRKTVNGFSMTIFKNQLFLMFSTATRKTVNGFPLSIFQNHRFVDVLNSKKQNGQWFFNIDIQKPKVFQCFQQQKAKRSMVFHYRYSKI